ncbi:hypothetical protein [Scytonema sp. NUACC26]|uniref:hypothetical protein n=1 Tax=Scytonema sp. NUACC26 TaxID=3140176 RepID=UPI0034DC3B83
MINNRVSQKVSELGQTTEIVEATSWEMDKSGEVVLTASSFQLGAIHKKVMEPQPVADKRRSICTLFK